MNSGFKAILSGVLLLASVMPSSAIVSLSRSWKEGPLNAEDFTAPVAAADSLSRFSGVLSQSIYTGGDDKPVILVSAMTNPGDSPAYAEDLTPRRLAYHQLQYDCLELAARRLQAEINNGLSGKEIEKAFARYCEAYAEEMERIAEATDYGRDTKAVAAFAAKVKKDLEATPEVPAARLSPSYANISVAVGTGPHWLSGSLGAGLGWAWDYAFALRFGFRRLRIEAQLTYAAPSVRNPYIIPDKVLNAEDAEGNYHANIRNANLLTAGVNLGLDVLHSRKFSVVPFAGVAFSHYSWSARPMEETPGGAFIPDGKQKSVDLKNLNLWFGVNCEVHVHTRYSSSPIMGAIRQQLVSSIGFTPYAAKQVYKEAHPQLSGWMMGFMISYSASVSNLVVRK